MITDHKFRNRRLRSAFVGIVFILFVLGNPSAAFAAGWSQGVVIAPSLPTTAPNAFAFNPAGNELWVTAPGVTGGAVVQVAQRSFGGVWSPLTTIATIHSWVLFRAVLSISLSANNNAAAAWLVGGGVQIALRSAAGVWQAPVSFATAGGASNLLARLDAQGNGVAVWSRLTSTGSVVEAVTWTASGAFGRSYSFRHPRRERSCRIWPSTKLEPPSSSGRQPLRWTIAARIRLSRRPGLPEEAGAQ